MPLPRAGRPTARAVKASAPLKTAARRPCGGGGAHTNSELPQAGFPESGEVLVLLHTQAPDAALYAIHVHAPSDGQMTCAPHPAAPHSAQLLQFSMCCVQWRQQQPDANALHRQLDQAWQGASPLQRRLATATSLRRPPHPLRCTGAAQHLSPMRALSPKRLLSVA